MPPLSWWLPHFNLSHDPTQQFCWALDINLSIPEFIPYLCLSCPTCFPPSIHILLLFSSSCQSYSVSYCLLYIHLSSSLWAAVTQYHRMGGLSPTEIYFSVLESDFRVPARLDSGGLSSRLQTAHSFIIFSSGKRSKGSLFYKDTNPIAEGSSFMV